MSRVLSFLLFMTLGGCRIRLELQTESQSNEPGDVSVLPNPSEGTSEDEPVLDAVQKARKEEAERYTMEVIYQGATILHTVKLPSGDVIDFIDRNTLPALPYSLPALPLSAEDLVLPPGVQLGQTELEQIPQFVELAIQATPFHRPTFWPYIWGEAPYATSIEDYLQRYPVRGEPAAKNRLYAGLASNLPNRGISGYMSQYKPEVVSDSMSLMEFTVACPVEGPVQEQIGIVISVDKINGFGQNRQQYQDGEARMHIEYARMVNGQVSYAWDGMDGTFIPNPLRLHQPGEIVPVSVLNQSSIEHLMAIFQVPTGDFWIAYNGDLLGYYPASLFTMLNKGACKTAWYGEIYRQNPLQGNIKTEMGSGQFAKTGLLNAAHVRNPKYYDPYWFANEPKDEIGVSPIEPLCYSRSPLTLIGAPWNSTFLFLGGPGGKNPGCKWP